MLVSKPPEIRDVELLVQDGRVQLDTYDRGGFHPHVGVLQLERLIEVAEDWLRIQKERVSEPEKGPSQT